MKKHKPNLQKALQPIQKLIPLNYLKAKPVFFKNQPTDLKNLLKFIPIDRLKTEKGLVNLPPKPISKCIELTAKNDTETL